MLARTFEWAPAIVGLLALASCDKQPTSTPPRPPPASPAPVEPSATTDTVDAAPALPPASSEAAVAPPPPSTEPPSTEPPRLTEKMARRIRSKLRKTHGATVLLVKTTELPTADGGVVVFGLYEYSRLQACVKSEGGGAAARKACIEQAIDEGEWYEDYERSDYDCNRQGLVRARFGTPPADDPEGRGGTMTIEADRALDEACRVSEVVEFAAVDVDQDGQLELAVAYSTVTPNPYSRGGGSFDAFTHVRGWYRETLEPQAEIVTGDWVSDDGAYGYVSSARVEFVDVDRDGTSDIRVTRYEAQYGAEGALPKACYPPTNGSPIDPGACEAALGSGDDEYYELGIELETKETVGRYVPKTDTWVFPAKP